MPAAAPGPLRLDGDHHGAGAPAAVDGHRFEAEAQVAARDAAVRFQASRNAGDGGCRDDYDAAARPEYGHAEDLAGSVDGDSALARPAQAHVKLEAGVYLAAAQGAPGRAGERDNAERGSRCAVVARPLSWLESRVPEPLPTMSRGEA